MSLCIWSSFDVRGVDDVALGVVGVVGVVITGDSVGVVGVVDVSVIVGDAA